MPKERKYRKRKDESSSSNSEVESDYGSSSRRTKTDKERKSRRSRSRSRERERRRLGRSRSRERYRRDREREERSRRKRSRSRSRSPSRRQNRENTKKNKWGVESRPEKQDKGNRSDGSDTEKDVSVKTESKEKSSHEKERKGPKVERIIAVKEVSKKESSPKIAREETVVKVEAEESDRREEETREKMEQDAKDQATIEEVEAAQKKIIEERLKRKERMAAWRTARHKEEEEIEKQLEEEKISKKGWTLEDDDDDEDNDEGEKMEGGMDGGGDEVDEVDPLDAYMIDLDKEDPNETRMPLRPPNGVSANNNGTTTSTTKRSKSKLVKVTKVKGQAEQKAGAKGELYYNDQDAVEYSDEENDNSDLANALSSIMKKTKKKELPAVDHKNIEYLPFRKDFYREVPELARMTPEEVSAYRIDLESIKIKGKDCPKPIKTWAQCGMSNRVVDVLKKNEYDKPTPIQAQAIPAIMSGRDLIAIAKTGSGKTLSFLLPMFRHIMDQPPLDFDDGPIALIFSPTRELAIQTYNECKKFCKPLKLKPVCVYGGAGVSEQIADLKRGAEIVVCTPGRMIDVLAANSGRVTNLRRATYLVMDEADRMFDMGFEPQVMRIISNMRPDKQTVMFSATFPRQMEALARKILTQPLEIQVGGRSVVCKDVEQEVVVLEEFQKFSKLLELLGLFQEKGSVLVFVERQESADYLVKDLMKSSYPSMALHGGMDQSDRDTTLTDFRNAVTPLLVATSVAARGLDVKNLVLVVNYDCPNHYEDYVHRCGRTGRAGNKGNAATFITPDQAKFSGEILKAVELSGAKVPDELSEMWKSYVEQMKSEGKFKPRRRAAGFSGKGYKFSEEESAQILERKLKQKDSLGMADDDDQDEYAILTMEKKLEEVFSGAPRKVDPSTPQVPIHKAQLPNSKLSKNLGKAAAIAAEILSTKNLGAIKGGVLSSTQTAATNVLKGEQVNVTGAALASQIAASLNARVGAGKAKASKAYLPAGTVIPVSKNRDDDNDSDEDVVQKIDPSLLIRWEEMIDINDFPQQIRFRITTRDRLDDIGEYAEAYISVRGLYIPPTKQPKETDGSRLHLLIESKSERSVSLAKQEIKNLVLEEAEKLASFSHSHKNRGRYTV